jgi:hypothetical protein
MSPVEDDHLNGEEGFEPPDGICSVDLTVHSPMDLMTQEQYFRELDVIYGPSPLDNLPEVLDEIERLGGPE